MSLGLLEDKIYWNFYWEHLEHLKTKLLTDIALQNPLCTCRYKPKSEKHLFVSQPPMSLETEPQPPGWSRGVPSIPRNLEKVQKYPQPVKWAIIFRANPSKLILKNIMFKYTCFVYGLLSLLSIGLNSSSKNNFLNKFCF